MAAAKNVFTFLFYLSDFARVFVGVSFEKIGDVTSADTNLLFPHMAVFGQYLCCQLWSFLDLAELKRFFVPLANDGPF